MNYATSSPAPTPGLSGNTPVSCVPLFFTWSNWRRQVPTLSQHHYRHLINLQLLVATFAVENVMASLTDHTSPYSQPVCQNCQTSTTPLWRRDEAGSVLCNACGLFLKLHGRARPISLKTDVIKSRNRVKSAGQAPKKKVILYL